MKLQSIQDNNTNFTAQLVIGKGKLPKGFRRKIEKLADTIGSNTDTVFINIGKQYSKDHIKTEFAYNIPGRFHIDKNYPTYHRDISITSVISGKSSKYTNTLEVFPNQSNAIRNVKDDILRYLGVIKKCAEWDIL